MKWPGLFPLFGRVLALPFVAVLAACTVLCVAVEAGGEYWLKLLRKK